MLDNLEEDELELEVPPIRLTPKGELLATPNNKLYLADWDTPVVAVCATHSYWDDLLPADMYIEEEKYEQDISHPNYCPERHAIKRVDIDSAVSSLVNRAKEELLITGCKDAEYHFTSGRESFRYDISSDYKANRKIAVHIDSRIVDVTLVRDAFIDHVEVDETKCFVHNAWEADDITVTKYTADPKAYVLASGDKDVLKAVQGDHRRLYRKASYTNTKGVFVEEVKDSWVHTSHIEARYMPYAQCMAGDAGDNIHGLYYYSVKKAMEDMASRNLYAHEELWEFCIEMYQVKGIGKEENNLVAPPTKSRPLGGTKKISKEEARNRALKNMRLVNMNQLVLQEDGTYKVVLFKSTKG